MGNNISRKILVETIASVVCHPYPHTEYDDNTVSSYLEMLAETEDYGFWFGGAVFLMDKRCGFLEPVLLNRRKSLLRNVMDQYSDVMVVGLEQSGSFTGKDKLFCAVEFESGDDMASDWIRDYERLENKKHLPVVMNMDGNRIFLVFPFKLFVEMRNQLNI